MTYTSQDDDNDKSSVNITDALSRLGVAADAKVTETLTALLRGEWRVDLENSGGDFSQAHLSLRRLRASANTVN